MAEKTTGETKGKQKRGLTFTCQECGKKWDISEMRRLNRFRPVLVVCPDCDVKLR